MLLSLQIFLFLLYFVKGEIQDKDMCDSVRAFPNLRYRLPSNTSGTMEDLFIEEGWYGEIGIEIPTTSPGYKHCGTLYPIHLKESLRDEYTGEVEEVYICMDTSRINCKDSDRKIKTIYCKQGFRAYHLTRIPQSNSAYCAGPSVTKGYPFYTTPVQLKVELNHSRLDTGHVFKCDFKESTEKLYYTVFWYVDGKMIRRSESVTALDFDKLNLKEKDLINAGITSVGFRIKCSFRTSYERDSALSLPTTSNEKFIGVEVLTKELYITIGKNEKHVVRLKPSVPFLCDVPENCGLDVVVENRNAKCELMTSKLQNCAVKLPGGQNWNTETEMEVKASIPTTYGTGQTVMSVLHLKTIESYIAHELWENVDLGEITIYITQPQEESKALEGKQCYAVVDPHILTFTQKKYDYMLTGTFILYRNQDLQQEVQMKTSACNGNYPTCICGLAVRAGRRVFKMNSCGNRDKMFSIEWVLCDDDENLFDVNHKGNKYEITFASKTVVTAELPYQTNTVYKGFMNVYIDPSSADIPKNNRSGADGLCGAVNPPEFVSKNGKKYQGASDEFRKSWRIGEKDINLFKDDDLQKLSPSSMKIFPCNCKKITGQEGARDSVTCDANKQINCNTITKYRATRKVCQTARTKRAAERHHASRPTHKIFKREVESEDWRNGWTEEKARKYCQEQLNKSAAVQRCLDVPFVDTAGPLEYCISDIKFMGDTTFSSAAVETVKQKCYKELEANLTLQEADTDNGTSLFDLVKEVACPNECSNHGLCSNGTCICEENYQGVDCGLDIREPPEVNYAEHDGLCDIMTSECSEISLFGGYFIEWEKSLCMIKASTMTLGGGVKENYKSLKPVYAESMSEAICPLPKSRKRRSTVVLPEEATVNVYSISITNNGTAFSNQSMIVVFNSKCQYCVINGLDVDCHVTGDFCMSGSDCYGNGEPLGSNSCYICSVNGDDRKWIQAEECKPPTEDEADKPLWIIGAVLGFVALVVITVIGLCYTAKRSKRKAAKVSTPPPYTESQNN